MFKTKNHLQLRDDFLWNKRFHLTVRIPYLTLSLYQIGKIGQAAF